MRRQRQEQGQRSDEEGEAKEKEREAWKEMKSLFDDTALALPTPLLHFAAERLSYSESLEDVRDQDEYEQDSALPHLLRSNGGRFRRLRKLMKFSPLQGTLGSSTLAAYTT